MLFFFFFSSRRRHTRWNCDWSSDVCSSDLVVKGKRVASNVKLALVVPGSGMVKEQAEKEGLDRVFREAGFEWREPGCSMRSEERRVGKECRSRWARDAWKKKMKRRMTL